MCLLLLEADDDGDDVDADGEAKNPAPPKVGISRDRPALVIIGFNAGSPSDLVDGVVRIGALDGGEQVKPATVICRNQNEKKSYHRNHIPCSTPQQLAFQ